MMIRAIGAPKADVRDGQQWVREYALALVANAHLVSASERGRAVEVDITGTPLMEELTAGGSPVSAGTVRLTEGAGLGVGLDPVVVDRLAVPRDEDVRDGNCADLVFGHQSYDVVPPRARTSAGA